MRRLPLLGLATVVLVVAAVAVQALGLLGTAPTPRTESGVRTVPGCPQAVTVADPAPVHLVADLAHLQVRDSAWRPAIIAAADQVVAGTIPAVAPNSPQGEGDPLRYLFDEGVALRRVTGVLGVAYASTHDPRYLDALAAQTVGVSRWADWNPGHPLDTAQVATAVALGYAWSRERMTTEERHEVSTALVDRLLAPYTCGKGPGIAARRTQQGNQATVLATSAVLSALAVRADAPDWSAAALQAGTASLARTAAPDGSGRSLADGPTVEGLMYTNYEAANVALLRATQLANAGDPAVVRPLALTLPNLDVLADWNERCGKVADPNVQDGWDVYPWVDRTTALAAMAASPRSGQHLLDLYDELQRAGRLTLPSAGSWPVPDGIGELILSQVTPGTAAVQDPQSQVAGGASTSRLYGCATSADTYALMTGIPNDVPHAHSDIGNVVVKQGEQTVLADLGQRDYMFTGGPVWRASTKAHSTLGVLAPDGTVQQERTGSGAVASAGSSLVMTSTSALRGIVRWERRVDTAPGTVRVQDSLTTDAGATVPLSASFLLAAAPAAVVQQPDGALRFTVADGSVWDLVPPAGATVTFSDASPTPPYVDAPDIGALAATHTLIVVHADATGVLSLTTELRRVG